jgi:low affinity Fe/Cu permease
MNASGKAPKIASARPAARTGAAAAKARRRIVAEAFHRFAHKSAMLMGTPWTFLAAVLVIAVWALSGPVFHYSDSWQLVINTGTTIVTFLMVFLIQNTQNRDAKAVHLKLDELIRAVAAARTRLVRLEELSDEQIASLEEEFKKLQEKHARDARPEPSR